MKKLLAILTAMLMVFAMLTVFTGCGDEDDDKKKDKKSSKSVSDKAKDDEDDKKKDKDEEEDKGESADFSIEKTVLLDKNDIKITATEVKEDWGETEINLLVENNGKKDVFLDCNALIVNNYMISNYFFCDVSAGKKSNTGLALSSDELEAAGIKNVGQIEMVFRASDPDTYDEIFVSDMVTLKTSLFDKMDAEPNDEGKELYNSKGIKIVAKGITEDDIFGVGLSLYIENKTGKNVMISCEDLSVNGFMVTPLFACSLYDQKMTVASVDILSDELEDNGIKKVKDVELSFSIYDPDTFDTIAETGALQYSVG